MLFVLIKIKFLGDSKPHAHLMYPILSTKWLYNIHYREEEDKIVEKLRKCVIKNYGTSPYPLPKALNLGSDLQSKEKVQQELYCANLPIPQTLINTVKFFKELKCL